MKKGFTLIELLAVIVILAIIAVIAVPIVLNIIDESKNNATLSSAEMYLNAVEMSVAQATLKDKNITDGTYKIADGDICLEAYDSTTKKCIDSTDEGTDVGILEVEVNGKVPTTGEITITNGAISVITLVMDEKTIVKNNEGKLVFKGEEKDENPFAKGTLAYDIIAKNGGIKSIGTLTTKEELVSTTNSGVYYTTDLDGTTYYFRGDVENNYVGFKIAESETTTYGFNGADLDGDTWECYYYSEEEWFESQEECEFNYQNCGCRATGNVHVEKNETILYFRIVRINGDGTIRLIYDGNQLLSNGVERDVSIYYDKYPSFVQEIFDEWYENTLKTKFDNFLITNQNYEDLYVRASYTPENCDPVMEECYFYSHERFENMSPSLESDAYKKIVNGKKHTVLTMDEVVLAGCIGKREDCYLNSGNGYWTLSHAFDMSGSFYYVAHPDGIYPRESSENFRVVINLKADVRFNGSGTLEDPYMIMDN